MKTNKKGVLQTSEDDEEEAEEDGGEDDIEDFDDLKIIQANSAASSSSSSSAFQLNVNASAFFQHESDSAFQPEQMQNMSVNNKTSWLAMRDSPSFMLSAIA